MALPMFRYDCDVISIMPDVNTCIIFGMNCFFYLNTISSKYSLKVITVE